MQRTVHLFVADTMADWEAAHAVAGINQPAYQRDPGSLRVVTAAVSRAPVRTMGGITIMPDTTLADIDPATSALLILPGGTAWDEGGNTEAVDVARSFLDAGVPVAAICGATAGLARGGLLDERRHTSNARDYLGAIAGYGGHAHYVDAPAVSDGDLITASGIAPVHFARAIFERLAVYEPPMIDMWFALHTGAMPQSSPESDPQ